MQETVCTAGELFLATHQGFHRQALLPAKARDEGMSAGELLFDKLPGSDDSANEASSWEVQTPISLGCWDDVQLEALLRAQLWLYWRPRHTELFCELRISTDAVEACFCGRPDAWK